MLDAYGTLCFRQTLFGLPDHARLRSGGQGGFHFTRCDQRADRHACDGSDPIQWLRNPGSGQPQTGLPTSREFIVAGGGGLPSVFLTAWFALFQLAHPRPGASLLVHSAAGGVGGAIVQLGKCCGCKVIGVVGASHKVEYVRELGADGVIDKSTQDLWAESESHMPQGFDVILDANGAATLRGSYKHLAPMGKLVVYGFHSMLPKRRGRPLWFKLAWDYLRTPRFNPLKLTGDNKSILAFNLSFLFDETDLLQTAVRQLLQWWRDGRIKPLKSTTYPFESVAEAHRALESGETTGKLVLNLKKIA